METIKFKCTLLSDTVISLAQATSGGHRSLDFIPGNNFLGITAATLYNKEDHDTWLLFHSGKVRFGDAHPAVGGIRTLRIPASFYHPKNDMDLAEVYVHHEITNHENLLDKQLKQCREGFYAFNDDKATGITIKNDFAIKSAYDTKKRRAMDEKMFGYESIPKGTEFYFEVEIDDEALSKKCDIVNALVGDRHIGRSRTAQYGLAKIEKAEFSEVKSQEPVSKTITVYADGRLIFFDGAGMPTFQPTPVDLGIKAGGAKICWEKSQVRTFQYAPWNFKRQALDSDRCGIEKGSVFVVTVEGDIQQPLPQPLPTYVGAYQNEGFGKVIYNPAFLSVKEGKNGLSVLTFDKVKDNASNDFANIKAAKDSKLVKFLKAKKAETEQEHDVYDKVKEFVKNNLERFRGERFASQWGTIRGIAMSSKPVDIRKHIEEYLDHGVAKEQWETRGRSKILFAEMNNHHDPLELQNFIINLASEMAKKLKK